MELVVDGGAYEPNFRVESVNFKVREKGRIRFLIPLAWAAHDVDALPINYNFSTVPSIFCPFFSSFLAGPEFEEEKKSLEFCFDLKFL